MCLLSHRALGLPCKHVPEVIVIWAPGVVWINKSTIRKHRWRTIASTSRSGQVVHSPCTSAARGVHIRHNVTVYVALNAIFFDVVVDLCRDKAVVVRKLEIETQVVCEGLCFVIRARITHTKTKKVDLQITLVDKVRKSWNVYSCIGLTREKKKRTRLVISICW